MENRNLPNIKFAFESSNEGISIEKSGTAVPQTITAVKQGILKYSVQTDAQYLHKETGEWHNTTGLVGRSTYCKVFNVVYSFSEYSERICTKKEVKNSLIKLNETNTFETYVIFFLEKKEQLDMDFFQLCDAIFHLRIQIIGGINENFTAEKNLLDEVFQAKVTRDVYKLSGFINKIQHWSNSHFDSCIFADALKYAGVKQHEANRLLDDIYWAVSAECESTWNEVLINVKNICRNPDVVEKFKSFFNNNYENLIVEGEAAEEVLKLIKMIFQA
jgi:hypothetical protein